MNDTELQRWLASQLPDEINYGRPYGKHVFQWEDGREIPYESWLHVVSLVEAKLDYNHQVDYAMVLWKLLDAHGLGEERGWWIMASATWQQRTLALMEVLK